MALLEADIEFLRDVVEASSGHVISPNQSYLFESRLESLAATTGKASVAGLVAEVRRAGTQLLKDQIAEAMTINETFFFRDMHPFDALRTHIVPQLIKARQSSKKLTIWCAASSTGQEPYSIAITLREYFPELESWDIQIFASDLCEEVLAKAKSGQYSQFEVNRGLPAKLLVKHFDREGSQWKVKDSIRSIVEFKKINLTRAWPMIPQCDVVFIRNVLIYFDSPTKELILGRLRKTIAQDGYLLLGGGETLINTNAPFVRESIGETVGYKPA